MTNLKSQKPNKPVNPTPATPSPGPVPPLFRKLDWLTAGITFLVMITIYVLTLAPELTLEDSGELITGSFYAGIPHPPGYPVWTIYSWLWTVLVPFGNMAWRVALGQAAAVSIGCGLLALMVSRGSSMLMEGIEELKGMTGKWESAICLVCGITAGLLVGLDGFMWSESIVVNRISVFGVPWVMIVMVSLMRWMYAPHQLSYLYWCMFCFGVCATIHQTLVIAMMGIEIGIIAAQPKLGRDLLFGNSLVYLLVLLLHATGLMSYLNSAGSTMLLIFHGVGIASIGGCIWLSLETNGFGSYWKSVIIMFGLYGLGASFYFYMPLSGMTNPPMQWGYPRTVAGFFHALSRGQYEKIAPTDLLHNPMRFYDQMCQLAQGITEEFNWVYACLALLPFLFILKMQKRERAWIIALSAIWACIGILLMILLNPSMDRSSSDLIRVFFASSHTLVAIMVGYGMALTAAYMATNYQRFRRWGFLGGTLATVLAVYWLFVGTGVHFFGRDVQISGFSIFSAESFRDLPTFATKLKLSSDEVSTMLNSTFSEATRKALANFQLDNTDEKTLNRQMRALRSPLIKDLNRLVKGKSLYNAQTFANVNLRTETKQLLLAKNSPNNTRLNQMLLEDAYPLEIVEIARNHVSWPELPSWIGQAFAKNQYGLPIFAGLILVGMTLTFLISLAVYRNRAPLLITLGLFALMPLHPALSHWFDSEQRGHMFGYWFGHDMFTPPFKGADKKPIYPEMAKDAVLFGGTDPGRFCPTYMVFVESFTPHDCQPAEDQKFDRRDVYIITQNALADLTYLDYIRAHYNRSMQIDPPFFQNFLPGVAPSLFSSPTPGLSFVDDIVTGFGAKVEKRRRTYTSWFTEKDFINLPAFAARLRPASNQDPLSKWIYDNLSKDTQARVAAGKDEPALRTALAKDLNRLLDREIEAGRNLREKTAQKDGVDLKISLNPSKSLEKKKQKLEAEIAELSKIEPLYSASRFAKVKLSHYVDNFIAQNPQSDTRVRLNRLLLEEAYAGDLATTIGGVYPDREIYIPSPKDQEQCFADYMEDAQRRMQMKPPQLKAGEDVQLVGDRVQITGQVAVMNINGLLTKVIFEKNPENEFYVEESFPLDWMYPHLTPYGIIMKINRQPLSSLTDDILKKDHDFWKEYSKRLTGDIFDYDTKVETVANWIEKTYLRHDFEGFTGDRAFVRDDDAQKAFSKLRSSIGGVYAWRLGSQCQAEYRPKNDAEAQSLFREANFAFLQAFAYCPYSPEAVFRYIQLLLQFNRLDDALIIAKTCLIFDPYNGQVKHVIEELQGYKQRQGQQGAVVEPPKTPAVQNLEAEFKKNPSNFQAAFALANNYFANQQGDKAMAILDTLVNSPEADTNVIMALAQAFKQMGNMPKLEIALQRLVKLAPDFPDAHYDYAALMASAGKSSEAIKELAIALDLNAKRLESDPKARDLLSEVRKDARFNSLMISAPFQKLIAPR